MTTRLSELRQATRDHERRKYAWLAANSPSYGAEPSPRAMRYCRNALRKLPRDPVIVDLGCGRNVALAQLAQVEPIRGIGIDWAMPEADVQADMRETGLADASADMVICLDALEHIIPEDVNAVLMEMRRIAKPGARFVFSISYVRSHHEVDGENLHPTVKPAEWWAERIRVHCEYEPGYPIGRIHAGTFR